MSRETAQDLFFESLYKRYFGRLEAAARAVIGDRPVAEELVQETFVIALRNYETLRRHEKPDAYLYTVLRYKISDYRRSLERYRRLCAALEHSLRPGALSLSRDPPLTSSGIVETAQGSLTEREWYLLRRFAIDGATHRQIAGELGITVDASQKRLERIRKKLEAVLPRDGI